MVLAATVLACAGCPSSRENAVVSIDAPAGLAIPAQDATPALDRVLARIDETLDANFRERELSATLHGGWQVMHGVLAYGADFPLQTPAGPQPAVPYLLGGGSLDGFELRPGDWLGDRRGVRVPLEPNTKVGQGHRDQWLAILVQCGLPASTPVRVDGIGSASDDATAATIEDFIRQTEFDIPLNLEQEFSWTLIALTAYRPTDHRWTARDGLDYNVESLLKSEIGRDLPLSVCGGTHRLNGIAMTLQKRRAEGRPVTGVWADAEALIERSIELARQNQNPDGSYSLAYFHRRGWARDLSEQLGTTGHVLEFLALSATSEQLREPWVLRCIENLCDRLQQCRDLDLECGVLYHALHGLQEVRGRLRS